ATAGTPMRDTGRAEARSMKAARPWPFRPYPAALPEWVVRYARVRIEWDTWPSRPGQARVGMASHRMLRWLAGPQSCEVAWRDARPPGEGHRRGGGEVDGRSHVILEGPRAADRTYEPVRPARGARSAPGAGADQSA